MKPVNERTKSFLTNLISLLVAQIFLCSSVLPGWASTAPTASQLRPSDARDVGIGEELSLEFQKTEAARDGGDLKAEDVADVRGKPVSYREAGITEGQLFAELKGYLESLPTHSASSPGAETLFQQGIRHIVFFYPYTLYVGGAPSFQRNEVEALLKFQKNLTIELLYLNFGREFSRLSLDDPVRNNRIILHGIPNEGEDGEEFSKPELAKRLRDQLQTIHDGSGVDLIVNNNSTLQYEMSRSLLGFAHENDIPTHIYFHGGLVTEGVRYLMQHSDEAVTNSKAFQDILGNLGVKADVIHPVLDLSYFMDPSTEQDQAAVEHLVGRYGLKGKKVIIHPARLYSMKGQEDTLRAAGTLKALHPELARQVVFVIIGPPRNEREEERLRNLARREGVEDVIFVGKQTREEMGWWYRIAYVVLYPTRGEEPFGLVAVEAQASGAPVIVTDVGGLPETLIDGRTGFVVDKGNPEQLAERIYTLVTDEERRDQMAKAAEEYVRETYPPEKMTAAYIHSFLRAVRHKRVKMTVGEVEGLPEPPVAPGRILFDLYAKTYESRRPGERERHSTIVDRWKQAWSAKLEESRPYWTTHPGFPFPLNEHTPAIAYDPRLIPAKELGPYVRLALPKIPGRGGRSVSRENPIAEGGESNLLTKLDAYILLEDPLNDTFIVMANRYPKVVFDSLLVSKDWQRQKLTPEAVRAELQWAHRGVVSEFHHPERFVDHLHLHLNTADSVPVSKFSNSFTPRDGWRGVAIGTTDYPIPHIALSSSDPVALERATLLLADQLEEGNRWFIQTVLPVNGSDEVVVLFYLLDKTSRGIEFSPVGFVKAPGVDLDDAALLQKLKESFVSPSLIAQVRESFLDRWKKISSVQDGGEKKSFVLPASHRLLQPDSSGPVHPVVSGSP